MSAVSRSFRNPQKHEGIPRPRLERFVSGIILAERSVDITEDLDARASCLTAVDKGIAFHWRGFHLLSAGVNANWSLRLRTNSDLSSTARP